MSAPRTSHLVCYDIGESPRRLARVHRRLIRLATPIQYSVFLARTGPAGLDRILETLARTIDPRRDDVRIYPIPADPLLTVLGRPLLPDGLLWSAAPARGDPPSPGRR